MKKITTNKQKKVSIKEEDSRDAVISEVAQLGSNFLLRSWLLIDKILPEKLSHISKASKNPRLEEKLNLHISYSNYMLFLCVAATLNEKGSLTMGELSRAVSVPLSTATRMADWMVENEYAERLSDSNDRRIVRLALTENGRRLNIEAKMYLFEQAAEIVRRLPKATQKILLINMKEVMSAWETVLNESK